MRGVRNNTGPNGAATAAQLHAPDSVIASGPPALPVLGALVVAVDALALPGAGATAQVHMTCPHLFACLGQKLTTAAMATNASDAATAATLCAPEVGAASGPPPLLLLGAPVAAPGTFALLGALAPPGAGAAIAPPGVSLYTAAAWSSVT
jgi:hypothetical protein